MALDFPLRRNDAAASDDEVALYREKPDFARYYTDHMAFAEWSDGDGWRDSAITAYAPFVMDPACGVLHYAQTIFEGLKAYRRDDGSVWMFRPEKNAERFIRSAARMSMPELPVEAFVESARRLIETDARWVPDGPDKSLYLRPFMLASESFLGVRSSRDFTYLVIATPVGPYFPEGVKPIRIWVTPSFTRAAPGGTGAAKCGGNYAASVLATQEAKVNGCNQVMFLDAVEHAWIEELGGMNVFMVTADGELVTPPTSGTILEGVTRDSILTIAPELGLTPVERRVSFAELTEGIADGTVKEFFACGTAAIVTPIGLLRSADGEHHITDEPGEATMKIRDHLLGLQFGRIEDTHDWTQRVV